MDNLITLDTEVYKNYFLVAFKNVNNGKTVNIEIKGADSRLSKNDATKLNTILHKYRTFGFNSNNFDMPIMLYALDGATANQLCDMSNHIINENSPDWMTMKRYSLSKSSAIKHFDISQPAPSVMASLKLYGARLNAPTLQDLPIAPNSTLTDKEMADILKYCRNDLDTNILLYKAIEKQIALRVDMSARYGQDLLSKSDAQIAETVIKSELQKLGASKYLKAPQFASDATFKYDAPNYINFKTKQLQDALTFINQHDFEIDGRGSIKLPKELKSLKIKLGSSIYQLGVGGIHSTEKSQTVIPNDNQILADRDVASYYPAIILNLGLYPEHLGENFLTIYKQLVSDRLKSKSKINEIEKELKRLKSLLAEST